MPQLFDENGEPVEAMSPEEVEALQARAEKAEQLEATLAEKEAELAKYSQKEFNFSNFREAEAAKREEMMKGYTEKEKANILEIEKLNAKIEEADNRYFGGAKESVLTQLAGTDADMRAKLEDAVKQSVAFMGPVKDASDLASRYERAYSVVTGGVKGVNPLNSYAPSTGVFDNPSDKKRFTDTAEGKAIFEQKFAKDIEKAKSRGFNI
jgi:hypothetical protein